MERISLFNKDRLHGLFSGCAYLTGQPFPVDNLAPDPLVSHIGQVRDNSENSSMCLTCNLNLLSREHQLEHYKCDWHRYNLKLKLNGRSAVSQNEFEDVINEISSISGSDSENEDSITGVTDSPNEDVMKLDKAINAVTIQNYKDTLSSSVMDENFRTPKIYLKKPSGEVLSFYRCIIPENFTETNNTVMSNLEQSLLKPVKCLIILFSAGHFAAGVFEGENSSVHKTFHRYVLRAKQGTVQSVRDNRGNAPKSGGAALRRHNEAALAADIQNLLNSWKKEYIDDCSHIFLRTPQYGKSVFYNGKAAPLERKDIRIRGIPFPTRRPTFSELKRVYREMFSITITNENASSIGPKEKVASVSENCNILEVTDVVQSVKVEISNENCSGENRDTPSKSHKKQKRKKQRNQNDSEPPPITVTRQAETEDTHPHDIIADELFTVCKMGNLVGLEAILADHALSQSDIDSTSANDIITTRLNQPVTNNNDTLLHVASKSGHRDIIYYLLNHGADPSNKNMQNIYPYQAASDKASRDVFRKFMAQYPTRYEYLKAQVPGLLTEDMENERKVKQQEKKKAQRSAKREKMKEQKAIKAKIDAEKQEKDRFAALSDREKRAIAAERRFAQQLLSQGAAAPSNTVRCWLCGASLLGKIPFEYFDCQFCSITCLKKHKSLNNVNK